MKPGAWLLPACLGLVARKTPFHLAVLGAGDGLELIADYLERPALHDEAGAALPGPEEYRTSPYPILSRAGFDPAPRENSSPLYRTLAREASGPRLAACAPERMPSLLPRAAEHEGLLVFSLGAALDAAAMARALAPWGETAFWVEIRGAELAVHRVWSGALESAALALLSPQGDLVLRKGWNFLQPRSPVRRPRVTIDEPPKAAAPTTRRKND